MAGVVSERLGRHARIGAREYRFRPRAGDSVNYAKTRWHTDPSLDADVREWILHGIRKLDDGRWGWRQDPASMAATIQYVFMPTGDELNAALPHIKCPTLTVRGAEGGLSRELAAERSRTIPNGKWVEIPNTTHAVQETNLAGFLAAVRDFLEPK